ncbi:MAG: hypothetical protein ACYCZT_13900 [Thiobacillus sp.]
MSLLLVLFYFIGIPALVIAAAVWLWRKSESPLAKGLVMVGAMATLAGLLWLAQGEKWLADRQVRELCMKDGGVTVFESVVLPVSEYERYMNRNWILPAKEKATSEDNYYYEVDYHYYRKGNPQVARRLARVIRLSDGKTLGQSITYSRGGGGLPGPWHEPAYICPPISEGRPDLVISIFSRGDEQ